MKTPPPDDLFGVGYYRVPDNFATRAVNDTQRFAQKLLDKIPDFGGLL